MAQLIVVYWRDIPAQVIVKAGRTAAKRQLTERFEKAIDRAAMRAGLRDTDSYLAEWRRADPVECGADLEAEAAAAAAKLEAEFTDARLAELVAAGGKAGRMTGKPAASLHSFGRLEALLRAGEFVLTAETSPPDAGTRRAGAGPRRLPQGPWPTPST